MHQKNKQKHNRKQPYNQFCNNKIDLVHSIRMKLKKTKICMIVKYTKPINKLIKLVYLNKFKMTQMFKILIQTYYQDLQTYKRLIIIKDILRN